MNKTSIEWADYTWNPIVGCKHGCKYCYAKRLNDRFHFIPKWDKPQFFPERLDDPAKVKKPSTIFVGSMSDIFGAWVDPDTIRRIINVADRCAHHKFMFLTKAPARYNEFIFPNNCWLGTTIDSPETASNRLKLMYSIAMRNEFSHIFASFEPLLGDMTGKPIEHLDLVIVGAMTGPGAVKPKKEWIKSIKHNNIFYKENIKKYL